MEEQVRYFSFINFSKFSLIFSQTFPKPTPFTLPITILFCHNFLSRKNRDEVCRSYKNLHHKIEMINKVYNDYKDQFTQELKQQSSAVIRAFSHKNNNAQVKQKILPEKKNKNLLFENVNRFVLFSKKMLIFYHP